MLLSVWVDTSSRNILWEPWVTVCALRAWKGLLQRLGPGSHTLQSIAFLLFQGEAEFLLSAALLDCFLATICLQRTSSCWENGPWGNFRDISAWREAAAAPGSPQKSAEKMLLLVLLGSPWCCRRASPVFNSGRRQQRMYLLGMKDQLHQAR